MRISKYAMTVYALCFLSSLSASGSILPKNDWDKYDRLDAFSNMTETDFHAVIDQVLDYYRSIVEGHGASLVANKLWTDPTVNASAVQEGSNWIVNMYGGLARRPEVNKDGFALVVCHELGHHLGGFPLKGDRWAATEGQSDYFATHACARKIWQDESQENSQAAASVHSSAKSLCDNSWANLGERNLCYRIANASQSLADLLNAIGGGTTNPNYNTPDVTTVDRTYESHPQAQCRLDTYIGGAACTDSFDDDKIPGRLHAQGQGSLAAELEGASTSCMQAKGQTKGLRPRCWFKPQLPFMALFPEVPHWQELSGNMNGVAEPGERIGFVFPFSNRTQDAIGSIQGTLTSTDNSVTINSASSRFPDMSPNQSTQNQDQLIATLKSNLACGSRVPFNLAATSDRGTGGSSLILQVGSPVTSAGGLNSSPLEIPNLAIVYSPITASVRVQPKRAFVRVDIFHSYSSDVILSLVAPNGKETLVARLPRSMDNHVKATYPVDLVDTGWTEGEWKLKIEDTYRIDSGTLNEWALDFESFDCE
jgi:hypothetical protein